jgi:hypothetical protein
MANRTYLYATNLQPTEEALGIERQIVGLAESSWSLPYIFMILLAGQPKPCISNIWKFIDGKTNKYAQIALCAPYTNALNNLTQLHSLCTNPIIAAELSEIRAFLSKPENVHEYILLEPAEYFNGFSEDEEPKGTIPEKVEKVVTSLTTDTVEELIAEFATDLNTQTYKNDEAAKAAVSGSIVWSNILYYEPNTKGAQG